MLGRQRQGGLARWPAEVLENRPAAAAAVLRMLSRARRRAAPLLLLALEVEVEGRGTPGAVRVSRWLERVTADLRLHDLCWWDGEVGAFLLLLEDAAGGAGIEERLRRHARECGTWLRLRQARFPSQGATLGALLGALAAGGREARAAVWQEAS